MADPHRPENEPRCTAPVGRPGFNDERRSGAVHSLPDRSEEPYEPPMQAPVPPLQRAEADRSDVLGAEVDVRDAGGGDQNLAALVIDQSEEPT